MQDDLVSYVWDQMGPRKHVAGRQRIAELVTMSVISWPAEVLGECRDQADMQIVAEATSSNLRRRVRERQYGMFWTLLLVSLASAVVQALLKWWLESRTNRVMMLVMRQEAT